MKILTVVLLLLSASFLTVYSQRMVKETMPGVPVDLVEFNGMLYFQNAINIDWELWTSDGTSRGTHLVKNFQVASSGDNKLKVWSNHLFFLRDHGLWSSDGTGAGTVLLKAFPEEVFLLDLTIAGDKVYFRATSFNGINELWKSDGSVAGTIKVTDITPLVTGSSSNDDPEFTYSNGLLFFWSTTDVEGGELWKSDGTSSGTAIVKDIYPGPNTSKYGFPSRLASFGDKVYFAADNGATGIDLWTSDGTEAGTLLVKNIAPGIESSFPVFMTVVGNTMFFNATNGVTGEELWKTDGTVQGTAIVKDIYPGPRESYPAVLTAINGELYFYANDDVHGGELWRSDGSLVGTQMVNDISPGIDNGASEEMTGINSMIFFTASEPSTGRELWVTSDEGTRLVKDINPGDMPAIPLSLTAVGGNLFFTANDGIHGRKLWVYGTALDEITGFTLVNAVTDLDIGPIKDGDVINLAALSTNKLNIRAETGLMSGSVIFKRNGIHVRTENAPPYAMAGDAPDGNYSIWTPSPGHYELCATPYAGVGRTGTAGVEQCIRFTVVNVSFGITHFTLVNADTDEDIMNFFDEDKVSDEDIIVFDLTGLPHPERINIRANTYPPVVDNVGFGFDGDDYGHTEATAPYSLFGDANGNYKSWQDALFRAMGGSCDSGTGYHHCQVEVYHDQQVYTTFFRFRLKYDDIRVTGFTLVDAATDTDILDIHEGDVIDLSTLPTNKLNIRVNTDPVIVGSVVMGAKAENTAPYTLYGDNNGNYNAWTATPGSYIVRATPFSLPQNVPFDWSRPKGVCGISNTVSFTLIESGTNKTGIGVSAGTSIHAGLQVYPNPNEGIFNITFSRKESAQLKVEIFDVFGKTVFNEELVSFYGLYQKQVDLGIYSQGIYVLRLQQGSETYLQKIVDSR